MEGWNDERGELTRRPLFSADSTFTDHLVTGIAQLRQDGFLALHWHEQAETYYVLAGEGVVTLAGAEHRCAPVPPCSSPGRPSTASATSARRSYASSMSWRLTTSPM